MTEPAITPELVAKHNLTPEEYAHAKEILGGREPSYTELGIFSVMWSEHCSYKNTRPLLKTFPTKSPKILIAGRYGFVSRATKPRPSPTASGTPPTLRRAAMASESSWRFPPRAQRSSACRPRFATPA